MKGESKIVSYSTLTIFDEDFDKLTYNASFVNSSVGSKYPNINIADKNDNLYIYIEGNVVGNFNATLYAIDSIGQTSEIAFSVLVYNCASKD